MFASLPTFFKDFGLSADVRTLLQLQKSIKKGLVVTFGDLYHVLSGLIVKSPEEIGPFTKAYYSYFLNIDIANGESLEDAVRRSKTYQEWKELFLSDKEDGYEIDEERLLDRFINQVHITSFDIKKIIDGRTLLDEDNPDLEDRDSDADSLDSIRKNIEKMADYSDIDMEELLDRMEKVADRQKTDHAGGSHWIGKGGISPYGNSGAAQGGIRVGGKGGGKMARKVIGNRKYFPVDMDTLLNDNNIDAALANLKGAIESTAEEKLNVEKTIKDGLKRGGLFLPEMEYSKDEKMQVILLIDNGGYSMDPYIKTVQKLFRKMKTRFAHDLKTFYFHNTIYGRVFTDSQRRKSITVERFCQHDAQYRIFVIGDASMAPYELDRKSFTDWQSIHKKFKKMAWLNPEPERYWPHTMTTMILGKLIPMFPLTPNGIEKSIIQMNKTKEGNS